MNTKEIRTIVNGKENITIKVGTVEFKKFSNPESNYTMQDVYNVDKWNNYDSSEDFIKAIASKIRYEKKKNEGRNINKKCFEIV